MKNSIFILGSFLISFFNFLNAQQTLDTLNGNSVAAMISDEGILFQKHGLGMPGYEVPAGSGNNLVFSGSLCFGGTNQNGDLKLSADIYAVDRRFHRGPISSTNDYLDTAYIYNYESGLWTVTKSEIVYHVDNHDQQGYVAPDAILNWPGNGNTAIGVASQLAPFIDINGNGVYEPYLGDYPCIKGDAASYQIFHENHEPAYIDGTEVGAEIHLMAYQFKSNNYIDSTTFIDVKLINRGSNSFNDFKTTFAMDPDIGFAEDDYIGSASVKNLVYCYNGDPHDEGGNGAPGYGSGPPAVGLVSLNKDFEYSWHFQRGDLGTPITDDPETNADFWNYMNGKWKDGTYWTDAPGGYGPGNVVQHIYDGNPYLDTGRTELNYDGNGNSNPNGDRRFFGTSGGEVFNPGDTLIYNYAIIYNKQGGYLENVDGLIRYADSVQHYFDNLSSECIQKETGVQDDFILNEENLKVNFEITRLDGEGNMSRAVTLHENSEQAILTSYSVDSIKYKRGKGPIEARLTDTVNHALGHFVIKFHEYNAVDSANWTIYHFDTIGGTLLDSAISSSAISIGDEQFFPQWEMAIRIKQENYVCPDYRTNCDERDKHALPLKATLNFENNVEWLTGVKNTNASSPLNWITSGDYFPSLTSVPNDSVYNINCYSSRGFDPQNVYSKLLDGIVAPAWLTRVNECYFTPIAVSETIGNSQVFSSITPLSQAVVYQPSIDIVFTADTSKWTRSPVIELNAFDQGSVGGGKAGLLRKSASVNKQGNPDGTGTGMGWFPGYAIDVETGRRLNIAFGENSSLTNDNGDDMIWNPTDRLMDNNGNFVLGGQHVIYVFGREEFGMPHYDEGAFIHQQLSMETEQAFKDVYANLSWVMQPLLKSGAQLNAADARLSIRINKEFKTKVLSNQNEGRPMFSWDVIPYDQVGPPNQSSMLISSINAYPNPATNQMNVVWNNVSGNEIKIFSFQGLLINTIPISANENEKLIDISGLSPGIYFVNIGSGVKKVVVN
ncbi:T9SS type A sorting domain-containing protein [Brumimicrobium aurantiacum]|uniref:T9SS C-terminal target domain-containing protein n=1 Tax=Brumimicrobium aurantiacum TaxID=1737063 RepID=A0A3E1F1F2_9FLAO|nr:T9SS type A sorting domain-containing protein [Brumimicrobium aurantiacum]RFC55573.1 T9SS C-terminal target domain-containing protein [Brumimicrobium aurantiacum]